MSYPYTSAYVPPLPALEVVLRLPDGGSLGPFSALADTGADATLVPSAFLEQLGARPFSGAFLRSQWGERRSIDLFLLDFQIAEVTLPGIEVAGDLYSREIILGRNVLNLLILLLDGPSQTTDLLTSRPRSLR